jgi:signal peptidase I
MKKTFKQNIRQFWHGWGCPLLIALLVATSFKSAVADWNIVPTGSMNPTIVEGDRIFVNKLAYDLKIPYTTRHLAKWQNPERGDIVVFFSPANGQRLVKRIIGLPGDTIAMRNNRLFINGRRVVYRASTQSEKRYAAHQLEEELDGRFHQILVESNPLSLHTFAPVKIPERHYFAMGDNRDNSKDSRYFGCVERSRIVGRATAVVISLESNKFPLPRWERFFSKLR